jgi:hypothetical protein
VAKNKFMKTLSIKLLIIICLACGSVFAQTNDELALQAEKLFEENKLPEAMQICEGILKTNAAHPLANYVCGVSKIVTSQQEKYLIEAEKTIKDKAPLYAWLGLAYWGNRKQNISSADLNTSLEYIAKAIKLNPKYKFSYYIRASIYLGQYKLEGLRNDVKLKETYYSDMEQFILLDPNLLEAQNEYAKTAGDLLDFERAIPVFSTMLKHPGMTNLDGVLIPCRNGMTYVDQVNYTNASLKTFNDSIFLMKSCVNAIDKYETNVAQKNQTKAKLFSKLFEFRQLSAEKFNVNYLPDPEYLAELNDAIQIESGYAENYSKARIDIYLSQKNIVKAEEAINLALSKWQEKNYYTFAFRIQKGQLLRLQNKYDEALTTVDAVIPDLEKYQYQYGASFTKLLADALVSSAEIRSKRTQLDLLIADDHLKKAVSLDSSLAEKSSYKSLKQTISNGITKLPPSLVSKYEAEKIAKETKESNELIAEEKRLLQVENDFIKESRKAQPDGFLKPEIYTKLVSLSKSRLEIIGKIIASNISQEDKDAYSAKRDKLAVSIKGIEDGQKLIVVNEKVENYNKKIRLSNAVECINCDAIGLSRANRKKVEYAESAVGFLNEAIGLLSSITPRPTSRLEKLFDLRRETEQNIRELRATFLNDF